MWKVCQIDLRQQKGKVISFERKNVLNKDSRKYSGLPLVCDSEESEGLNRLFIPRRERASSVPPPGKGDGTGSIPWGDGDGEAVNPFPVPVSHGGDPEAGREPQGWGCGSPFALPESLILALSLFSP